MSRPIILLGAGGHARVLFDVLRDNEQSVTAIVSPDNVDGYAPFNGISVLTADDEIEANFDREGVLLVNGIGVTPGKALRFHIAEKFQTLGYTFATIISKRAIISRDAAIMQGAQILPDAIINAGAIIGKNAIINSGAIIEHDCVVGDNVHVAPGATVCGGVEIAENVIVGAGATVIQCLSIGESSIIGAGATVTKSIGEKKIVYPARSVVKNIVVN